MCGILGYVSEGEVDAATFEGALGLLACRGPDAQRIRSYRYGGVEVVLGHTRLAVIDPRPEGNQPMEGPECSIVFNGEIYNFKELRPQLEKDGHLFRTRTDTEVLLAAHRSWGEFLVDHIEGMFSFAIFDSRKGTIFCARDHFGKKPFYYYLDDRRFVFASETKALLAFPEIWASLSIDRRAVAKFLFYGYVPSPDTVFRQVRKLEPATRFRFDIDRWSLRDKQRFWKLEEVDVRRDISESEALDGIEHLLGEAVRKRMIADVPLGVLLSGGVDSSLVMAMAARESKEVAGFTVTYLDYEDDESQYASRVAEWLGIEQHCTEFNEGEARDCFLEMMDYLDEPIADAAVVPLFFIARSSRPAITVALGGDGGDELFGGYPKYRAQLLAERLGRFATPLSRLRRLAPGPVSHRLLEGFGMPFHARQFYYGSGGFSPGEATGMLGIRGDASWLFAEASRYDSGFRQGDTLNESLYLDCMIQLPDWYLVKADRATMAASLEMRSPLLDKNLAEYAFGLPGSMKVRDGETKYLLKKLAARYLPPDVVYRKKQGFAVPLGRWIETVLAEDFRRTSRYDFGLFDMDSVRALLEGPGGRRGYGLEFRLLRIFVLNHYLDKIGWEKGRVDVHG